jgi:hypothetical protein
VETPVTRAPYDSLVHGFRFDSLSVAEIFLVLVLHKEFAGRKSGEFLVGVDS